MAGTDDLGDVVASVPSGSSVWSTAQHLLDLQPSLRSELARELASLPRTGLYAEEELGDGDDEEAEERRSDFASLARRTRKFLALSPKTVLLRAIDAEVERISGERPDEMAELVYLLEIPSKEATLTIRTLVAAVESLPKGRAYRLYRRAIIDAEGRRAPPWESDPITFRDSVKRSIMQKRGGSEPEEHEVDAAVARAMLSEGKRRDKAVHRAKALEKSLEIDVEYCRWRRAMYLWEETGMKALWEGFLAADKKEGHERRRAGDRFEQKWTELCFAAIVLDISGGRGDFASYSYLRNALWADHTSRRLGEVDLVILDGGKKVVALCEMKQDCVEIASAFDQHTQKLEMALSEGPEGIRLTSPKRKGKATPLVFVAGGIHETAGSKPISADVQIYVATCLPNQPVLGVHPAVSHAICEGIRAQGINVRDDSTAAAAGKLDLTEMLEAGIFRSNLIPEGSHRDRRANGLEKDEMIDFLQLENFVKNKVGLLTESPFVSFQRRRSRVLVMDES